MPITSDSKERGKIDDRILWQLISKIRDYIYPNSRVNEIKQKMTDVENQNIRIQMIKDEMASINNKIVNASQDVASGIQKSINKITENVNYLANLYLDGLNHLVNTVFFEYIMPLSFSFINSVIKIGKWFSVNKN
jgi:regulator of replication initiation timing